MKLVILAAGEASQLYPLTLTVPKPLLEVAGRTMIDRVLDCFSSIEQIDEILVVSDAKCFDQFEAWATARRSEPKRPITVINDGVTDQTAPLGAIGDLGFVVKRRELDDDLIVVGGDNLFSQALNGFGELCLERSAPILGVYDVGRLESTKLYSEVHTDMSGQVTSFEEKPQSPSTTMVGIALYFYPKTTVPTVLSYLESGHSPEQPGRLIQWMYPRMPVYTWSVPGIWYDIGSKERLEEANRIFQNL